MRQHAISMNSVVVTGRWMYGRQMFTWRDLPTQRAWPIRGRSARSPATCVATTAVWANCGEREAREWHKGDRVPPEYRGHQYAIDRWQEHRLSRPPRGYKWVQVRADYVLISVGIGVIAQRRRPGQWQRP